MSVTGGAEWLWLPHVHWGAAIALYLFLGGVAGAAYITSGWASLMKHLMDTDSRLGRLLLATTDDSAHRFACAETARWGALFSVVPIAIGGVALLSHLGAPLRALTFPVLFTNFGSWLVIGTWVIVLFTAVATFEMLWLHFGQDLQSASGLSVFPRKLLGRVDDRLPLSSDRGIVWLFDTVADTTRLPVRVHGVLRAVGAVLSVSLIAYTALLLSDVAYVPLWERTYLPLIFLLSGASTGISAALLGTVLSGGALTRMNHRFCLTDDVIIVAELVVIGLLLSFLANSSTIGAEATETALFETYNLEFVWGVLILGTAFPVVLSVTVTMLHQFTEIGESLWGKRLLTGGYALKYTFVLLGGFLLRYVVLLAAVKAPLPVPGL
jgi:protein NrfD